MTKDDELLIRLKYHILTEDEYADPDVWTKLSQYPALAGHFMYYKLFLAKRDEINYNKFVEIILTELYNYEQR